MDCDSIVSFIFQDDSRLDVKKSFLKVYPKCLLSCVAENPYTLIEDINCFYVDAMPFSIEYITKAGKYNYKSFDVLPREVLYNYLETLETYFPTATKVHSNFELYLQNYFYTLCENYLIEIIPFGKENSKDKCLVFLNINEWLCDRLKDCNFIIKKKQIKAIQLCLSKFSRNNMNSIFSQKLMQKYPDINQYIINVTESNNYLLLNFYDSSFIYNEEMIQQNNLIKSLYIIQHENEPIKDVVQMLENTNKDNLLEYIYFEGDDIQGFYKFLQNKEYKHLKSITIMSTNYDDCMKYIKEFNLFGIYVNIKIFDESLMESSSIIREKNINSLYISYSNIISKTIPKIDLSLSVTIFNDKNKYSTLKSLLLSDVNMFLSVIIYFDKSTFKYIYESTCLEKINDILKSFPELSFYCLAKYSLHSNSIRIKTILGINDDCIPNDCDLLILPNMDIKKIFTKKTLLDHIIDVTSINDEKEFWNFIDYYKQHFYYDKYNKKHFNLVQKYKDDYYITSTTYELIYNYLKSFFYICKEMNGIDINDTLDNLKSMGYWKKQLEYS